MNAFAKNTVLGVIAPVAGRLVSNLDRVEQWLRIASLAVGLGVGTISLVIAGIQLYRIIRDKLARRKAEKPSVLPMLAIAGALILGSGCTFAKRAQNLVKGKAVVNAVAIAEESRALTTGIVDALSVAPTNEPTKLAMDFAKKDQLLEGIPQKRVDVPGLLAGDKAAIEELGRRFELQGKLIAEKAAIEAKLRETEARLIEMGRKYEEEKNRSIVKRVWRWAIGTLGISGLVLLCVFCPAFIPIFARAAAWIVSMFPKLAGAIGVVSTKAYDAALVGVEKAKAALDDEDARDTLHTELSKAMDVAHKKLVRARKPVVTQPV